MTAPQPACTVAEIVARFLVEQLTRLGSVGREWAGSGAIRMLDADRREVPDGQVGELHSRTAYVFDGYWKNAEKTAEAFRLPPGRGPAASAPRGARKAWGGPAPSTARGVRSATWRCATRMVSSTSSTARAT